MILYTPIPSNFSIAPARYITVCVRSARVPSGGRSLGYFASYPCTGPQKGREARDKPRRTAAQSICPCRLSGLGVWSVGVRSGSAEPVERGRSGRPGQGSPVSGD
jgi:hypothetical protein